MTGMTIHINAASLAAAAIFAAGATAAGDGPAGLPDGPGRDLVMSKCSECHSVETVTGERHDRAGWSAEVDSMVDRGLMLSDDDYAKVVQYLTQAFPASPSSGSAPGKDPQSGTATSH